MPLSEIQKNEIKSLLERTIENFLEKYTPETFAKPFLVRLVQADTVATSSFVHSLSTTLGMSIYEQISNIIVEDTSQESSTQYKIKGFISDRQKLIIEDIIMKLSNCKEQANHNREVKEVLSASSQNDKGQETERIADFYMKRDDKEHYFEIKTPKPNKEAVIGSKRKLLEWVALRQKSIKVFIAFPYNPYHPDSYNRFTVKGILDKQEELLIGEEYWDFIGGEGTFRDLKKLFDEVGRQSKRKIREKIKELSAKYS